MECEVCGDPFEQNTGRGRKARFCSTRCRMVAYRERKSMPSVMRTARRWVAARGKRPVMVDGSPASSTNPATWTRFEDVQALQHGFMLGGGVGCYDLDDVTDDEARMFRATIPERVIYAERSKSGRGVHFFVLAEESPGWKRIVDGGISVERYTRARFILMTHRRFA